MGSYFFLAIYLFVLFWFGRLDVWARHFSDSGSVYLFYNLLRIVFLLYLTSALFFLGTRVLKFIQQRTAEFRLGPLSYFITASFLGAAALQVLMVLLGLFHLYYRATAVLVTSPLVFLSFSFVQKAVRKIPGALKTTLGQGSGYQRTALTFLVSTTFLLALDVLVRKGLFPDTLTNDPVGHYLPYYQEVLHRHNLWPNQYFFHYFMSRGAGLVHLAIFLTDLQAPQLVSYYFLFLSSITLFALIKKISETSPWPWVAVLAYLSSSVILLEPEFAKHHIPLSFWFASLLWFTFLLLDSTQKAVPVWRASLVVVLIALILFSPPSFPFIFPFFLALMVVNYLRKKIHHARTFLVLSITTAGITCLILLFNYITFGLFEISPILFSKFANLDVMSRWMSPSAFHFILETAGSDSVFVAPWSLRFEVEPLWLVSRLDLLYDFFPFKRGIPNILFLIIFFGLLAGIVIKWRSIDRNTTKVVLPVGMTLVLTLLNSMLVVSHSVRRYTSFVALYVIVACVAIWELLIRSFVMPERRRYFAILLALLLCAFGTRKYVSAAMRTDGLPYRFAVGLSNYREAYGDWIPESCLKVRQLIGPQKVLLLNFFPGCYALPGIRFERPIMNSYLADFHRAMYEGPEEAKEIFARYGIHYFLVDLKENFHLPAFSPLFQPPNVGRFFKVLWESEGAYLLTWKQQEDERISEVFLKSYSEKYEEESKYWIAKANERVRRAYVKPSRFFLDDAESAEE